MHAELTSNPTKQLGEKQTDPYLATVANNTGGVVGVDLAASELGPLGRGLAV